MDNPTNPADGTFVVVQNGQRVTAPITSQHEAETEAARRNKLNEASGQPVPEHKQATVKRNLMG